jgi:hypothetical protein
MEVFDLSNAPPFTALSYTWGPVSSTFDIFVNGEPVSIRKGLYRFLQAYDGDAYLWIDQICIDQSNVLERNHQVGMMSSIYTQCRSVIIWLGRLRTRPRAPIIFNSTRNVEALAAILQHEYFTRLWIVQEVLLAQDIHVLCHFPAVGSIWVSWVDMCSVFEHSQDALGLLNIPSAPIALLRENGRLQQQGRPIRLRLGETISTFSGGYCQDPRDKMYGLMGLVKYDHRVAVDYRKSIHEVFLDVVEALYGVYRYDTSHLYGPSRAFDNGPAGLESFFTTLMVLSAKLGLPSDQHEGLQNFLKAFWAPITDIGTRKNGLSIAAMGFSPRKLGENGLEISTHDTKEGRAFWWYDYQGWTYEFYCPPLQLANCPLWHLADRMVRREKSA